MSGAAQTPTRIRVVELIKALDPGGAESLLVARLAHADHSRFDYRVACLDQHRQEWLPELQRNGLTQVPVSASTRWDWRWVRELRSYLIDERIDVIHTHSPLAAVGVRMAVRSIRGNRPASVTTEHTERMNWATQVADLTTAPLDDLVIAVSEATRNAPVCRRARRAEVIDHGVDLDRIRRAKVDRHAFRQMFGMSTPCVVSVANFRAAKGHDDLLEVAQLVHSSDADVHFYVAGQGPLEGWVRQQVFDRGMGEYFHVVGSLPEAVRLAIAGDVFALTSRWEGRSVAVMEALAAGTPVVAFSVGGMPEMITDRVDGFLIPARDTRLFAQRLLDVLHDPATAAEIGSHAADSSARYDISEACSRIEEIYEELVRTRELSRQ